jgi:hypothetical protein
MGARPLFTSEESNYFSVATCSTSCGSSLKKSLSNRISAYLSGFGTSNVIPHGIGTQVGTGLP